MSSIEAIILGLVQGLTEFIPISSSGHLVIGQSVFGTGSDHLFLEFINIGTLLALVVYFRQRIVKIADEIFVDKNTSLLINILLTSIPAGVVGWFLSDMIASSWFFASLMTVAVSLIVVGFIMVILEKLPKASSVKDGSSMSKLRAFAIGIAQMFALIPGVSRSGSTIIAGRLAGLSSVEAAEYSFLASLPIMTAVALKNFVKYSDRAYFLDHMQVLIIGNITAFIAGILAIGFLMTYLKKHGLSLFGWYRIAVGISLVAFICYNSY